jgi:hypothetical protein
MSIDTTAAMVCSAYLDGLQLGGWARVHQEFDHLPEAGKEVWRNVVRTVLRFRPMTESPLEMAVAQVTLGDAGKLDEVLSDLRPGDLAQLADTLAQLQVRVSRGLRRSLGD